MFQGKNHKQKKKIREENSIFVIQNKSIKSMKKALLFATTLTFVCFNTALYAADQYTDGTTSASQTTESTHQEKKVKPKKQKKESSPAPKDSTQKSGK